MNITRRYIATLSLVGLILAGVASTQSVSAAQLLVGETLTVSSRGQDVYAAGGQIVVDSPSEHDLVLAGGTILINAKVGGDLLVAGGNISINAPIADDVRAAGGSITITDDVGGDVFVFAGSLTLTEGAKVGGDIILGSGAAIIDGQVAGNVTINAGDVTFGGTVGGLADVRASHLAIEGTIKGNAVVVGSEQLRLGGEASFGGDVRYYTRSGHIDFGSRLAGEATFDASLEPVATRSDWGGLLGVIAFALLVSLVWNGVVILAALLLLRRPFDRAAEHMAAHVWMDLGIGLLFFIATPIIAVLLMVTVVGLPLGGLLMVGYVVALLLTKALPAIVLGRWIERRYKKTWGTAARFGVAFGIMTALQLIGLIPFIGWVPSLLAILLTYGALLVAKREAWQRVA